MKKKKQSSASDLRERSNRRNRQPVQPDAIGGNEEGSISAAKIHPLAKVDPERWKKMQKKLLHSLRSQTGGADHKGDGRDLQFEFEKIWRRFHNERPSCTSDRQAELILERRGLGSLRTIQRCIAEGRRGNFRQQGKCRDCFYLEDCRKEGKQKAFTPDQDTRGFWGKDLTLSGWVQDAASWQIGDGDTWSPWCKNGSAYRKK